MGAHLPNEAGLQHVCGDVADGWVLLHTQYHALSTSTLGTLHLHCKQPRAQHLPAPSSSSAQHSGAGELQEAVSQRTHGDIACGQQAAAAAPVSLHRMAQCNGVAGTSSPC